MSESLSQRGNSSFVRTSSPGQVARDAMFGTTHTISYQGPRVVEGFDNKQPPERHQLPSTGPFAWRKRGADYQDRSFFFDLQQAYPVKPYSPYWRQGEPIIAYKDDGFHQGQHSMLQRNSCFPLTEFVSSFNGESPKGEWSQEFISLCINPDGSLKYKTPGQFLRDFDLIGVLRPASLKTPGDVLTTMGGAPQVLRSLLNVCVQGRMNVPAVWEAFNSHEKVVPGEGYPCGLLIYYRPVFSSTIPSAPGVPDVPLNYTLALKPCNIQVAALEIQALARQVRKSWLSSTKTEADYHHYYSLLQSPVFVTLCTPVASSGDYFPLDPKTGFVQPEIYGKRGGGLGKFHREDPNAGYRQSVQDRLFSTVMLQADRDLHPLGQPLDL